jgi:hypothetical protein
MGQNAFELYMAGVNPLSLLPVFFLVNYCNQ